MTSDDFLILFLNLRAKKCSAPLLMVAFHPPLIGTARLWTSGHPCPLRRDIFGESDEASPLMNRREYVLHSESSPERPPIRRFPDVPCPIPIHVLLVVDVFAKHRRLLAGAFLKARQSSFLPDFCFSPVLFTNCRTLLTDGLGGSVRQQVKNSGTWREFLPRSGECGQNLVFLEFSLAPSHTFPSYGFLL